MKKKYSKEVKAVVHLIDSGIMTGILDTIIQHKCQFKVNEFKVGTTNIEPSGTRITISADTQQQLDKTLNELNLLGCTPVEIKEVRLINKLQGLTGTGFAHKNQEHYCKIKCQQNSERKVLEMAKIIGMAVRIFLSLLGIIFIIMMLYGGYNYMTATGDESKVEKSRKTIMRAIIGLIITVSSYAIWNFIFYKFLYIP